MDMKPIFYLAGQPVTAYALCVVIALFVGILLLMALCTKEGMKHGTGSVIALLALPLGLMGARLGYCLSRIAMYQEMGLQKIFALWDGGFMLWGAVAGAALAGWIAGKITRQKAGWLLDAMAAPGALVIALCRFAEYFSGEGLGMDVLDEKFMRFPFAVTNRWGEWYWAVFMLEGLWALAMLIILLKSTRAGGEKARLFLILYSAAQIVLESLRRDSYLRWIYFVRVSQLVSALVIAGLMIWATVRWARHGHNRHLSLRDVMLSWVGVLSFAGIVIALEFAADGKILVWMPIWAIYLVMAACGAGMGALCGRMALVRRR